MQVKRFVAADMRRALELVRQELGPDAIILSSNRTKDGVELLTTLAGDSEFAQMQQQPLGKEVLSSASPMMSDTAWKDQQPTQLVMAAPPELSATTAGSQVQRNLAEEIEQARERMLANRQAEESAREFLLSKATPKAVITAERASPRYREEHSRTVETAAERYGLVEKPIAVAPTAVPAIAPVVAPQWQENAQLSELQAELADMRLLLEQQLGKLTGQVDTHSSPVLASIGRRLERMGLASELTHKALSLCKKSSSLSEAWPDVLAHVARQIPVTGKDVVEQGGVFALVGPTGVGKTTTIGKLAARHVLKYGADQVALVTTDTYRIAGHEQLKSLARILRVPMRVVDDANPLEQVLNSLAHCSLILIDTAGFRHGDAQLKQQLESLARIPKIKSYLVLSSNSQQQMLKASMHAYSAANLKGCILTKLDETASLGEALGVISQARLPLAYTTDGQDIPKNIDLARGYQLVSRAASLLKNNPSAAMYK